MSVLVGGGSDGVNMSESNGLKGMMQQALPWLCWSWCCSHRLKLACKDAFSSPLYYMIQEMLRRLYYIYVPKNLETLNVLVIVSRKCS